MSLLIRDTVWIWTLPTKISAIYVLISLKFYFIFDKIYQTFKSFSHHIYKHKIRQNTPHFDAFSTLFSVFGTVVRHALTWLPYYFKLDKIFSKKSKLRERFSIQASQSESPQKWPWKVELKGNKKIDPSSQLKLWPNPIYRLFTPKSQHIFIFSFAIPRPSDLTSKWGIARNLTGNWTPTPEWDAIPSLVPLRSIYQAASKNSHVPDYRFVRLHLPTGITSLLEIQES